MRRQGADAGYTLTEMLVVVAVIALIAALLTPGVISQLGRARAKSAQLQLDNISASLEAFLSDVGRYPTEQEGLQALVVEPAGLKGWTGPYVKNRRALVDPWGAPVIYAPGPGGRSGAVKSLGSDGAPGGSGAGRDLIAPDDE